MTKSGISQSNPNILPPSYQKTYIDSLKESRTPIPGTNSAFLQIESWMQRSISYDNNYPLILIFEEEINQIEFFFQFLEYEKKANHTVKYYFF